MISSLAWLNTVDATTAGENGSIHDRNDICEDVLDMSNITGTTLPSLGTTLTGIDSVDPDRRRHRAVSTPTSSDNRPVSPPICIATNRQDTTSNRCERRQILMTVLNSQL